MSWLFRTPCEPPSPRRGQPRPLPVPFEYSRDAHVVSRSHAIQANPAILFAMRECIARFDLLDIIGIGIVSRDIPHEDAPEEWVERIGVEDRSQTIEPKQLDDPPTDQLIRTRWAFSCQGTPGCIPQCIPVPYCIPLTPGHSVKHMHEIVHTRLT